MASINGFRYEPWESTSSIARRDFRHSNDEMEEKYWKGSKRPKSSPNKKIGCPENNGDNHVFEIIQYNHKVIHHDGYVNHCKTYRKECIGCGKVKKHLYHYMGEPFQIVEKTHDYRGWSIFH